MCEWRFLWDSRFVMYVGAGEGKPRKGTQVGFRYEHVRFLTRDVRATKEDLRDAPWAVFRPGGEGDPRSFGDVA